MSHGWGEVGEEGGGGEQVDSSVRNIKYKAKLEFDDLIQPLPGQNVSVWYGIFVVVVVVVVVALFLFCCCVFLGKKIPKFHSNSYVTDQAKVSVDNSQLVKIMLETRLQC